MSDLISREDAIKTAHLPTIEDAGYEVVRIDDILALPSAQPEIIECEDCKHWERESCVSGYCHELGVSDLDEDFYCRYAERKTDETD